MYIWIAVLVTVVVLITSLSFRAWRKRDKRIKARKEARRLELQPLLDWIDAVEATASDEELAALGVPAIYWERYGRYSKANAAYGKIERACDRLSQLETATEFDQAMLIEDDTERFEKLMGFAKRLDSERANLRRAERKRLGLIFMQQWLTEARLGNRASFVLLHDFILRLHDPIMGGVYQYPEDWGSLAISFIETPSLEDLGLKYLKMASDDVRLLAAKAIHDHDLYNAQLVLAVWGEQKHHRPYIADALHRDLAMLVVELQKERAMDKNLIQQFN